MSPWLRAGLIGGVVLIVLNLIGLIPYVACLTLPLTLFAYVAIGAMAAAWIPPERQAGPGAGQGALAALIAALIGGLVGIIVSLAQVSMAGAWQMAQVTPEMMDMFRELGVPPDMVFGMGGALVGSSLCCGFGMVLAAALGAIGGAIYAAVKPV